MIARIKHIFFLTLVISIFGSVSALIVHAIEKPTYTTAYGVLLSKYVKNGEKEGIKASLVDYESWGKDISHRKALHLLKKVDPKTLTDKEKMAFWINAYNLLTIDLIVKTGETESIRNQGSLLKNVWKSHTWKIHGKQYTLDEIEHSILRPMGDPRIHVAINCASLSCPDLRAEPYDAAKLETQLDAQTNLFLADPSKGMLITDTGLKVSKIFKWFGRDFKQENGVESFIYHYVPEAHNKKISGYFDYNWRLNRQ